MNIGIDVSKVRSAAEGPEFRLGSRMVYDDPDEGRKEYMYVEGTTAACVVGDVCIVLTDFSILKASATNAAPGTGQGALVGGAAAAIPIDGFGWVQVYGKGPVNTAASAAAYTALYVTATAGRVDDAATTGLEVIDGLTLGTATGGAAAVNEDGFYNFPTVGATAG